MLRPKTTTISERAELNMEETGEEVVEDIVEETPSQSQLHPSRILSCLGMHLRGTCLVLLQDTQGTDRW